jgi:hypothetical protein
VEGAVEVDDRAGEGDGDAGEGGEGKAEARMATCWRDEKHQASGSGRQGEVDQSRSNAAGRTFTPSPEQARKARHLGHRLELARGVAAGVGEQAEDLKQRLDMQGREVRRGLGV